MGRASYRREFVVYLSLIGNFYTMYGLDEVSVTDDKIDDMDFLEIWFEPVLYPHPYSVYKKWFLLFHQTMKETCDLLPANKLSRCSLARAKE